MELSDMILSATVIFSPVWIAGGGTLPGIPGVQPDDEYLIRGVRADKEFLCLLQHEHTGELTLAPATALRIVKGY